MTSIIITKEHITKYNIAAPRYTSYPMTPVWSSMDEESYKKQLEVFANNDAPIALYVHIPFCQSMCYYCGCHTKIRDPNSSQGEIYLAALIKEISLLTAKLGTKRKVVQLHWGGGTPTFLGEAQIARLFNCLNDNFVLDKSGEIAIEIDPRVTTHGQLALLRQLGFNRISMGIQDFDPKVQIEVNRVQPYALVKDIHEKCRELGFNSINMDLIYGLPYQTTISFKDTVAKILTLMPDRIALFSYAHVPWLKKHQRLLKPETFPSPEEKLAIFLQTRQDLCAGGYQAIAMDHFALAHDELAIAYNSNCLHRNCMGYTTKPANYYLGIGLSAIGALEGAYFQNHRELRDYYKMLGSGILPVEKGKILSADDLIRQWVINQLMCYFRVSKKDFASKFKINFDEYFIKEQPQIAIHAREELLITDSSEIRLLELGKIFVRNVCMGFDNYINHQQYQGFSKAI